MSEKDSVSSNQSSQDDEIDLLELLYTILDGKWLISFFILIATVISIIYAYGQVPTYKGDTLLIVETKQASIPGLGELAGLGGGGGDTSVGTELELIKSRKILGSTVDELKLDIITYPERVYLLGHFYQHFFSLNEAKKITSGWDWLDSQISQYAWGNEFISISRLEVSDDLLNKPLRLVLKQDDFYEVFYEEKLLLKGQIGQAERSANGKVRMYVAELVGLPGTSYIVLKKSKLTAIKDLQKSISVSEKGKKTGVINLSLQGSDKKLILDSMEHISRAYISHNKSRGSEEASKALKFLEEQIKPVKRDADKAEARLSQYRTANQTADMSMETQGVLALAAEIDTELQKLSLQRDELGLKYTANHPSMKVIISQQEKLKQRKKKTLSKISSLPKKQQDLLKLERDFKVTNTIYHDLLNNIQEFKIAEASSVGSAYVLDTPVVYEEPIKPKKPLILALGFLLGAMLGVLFIFLRKALHQTVDNPETVEEVTGIPVYATVPLSKAVKLTRVIKSRKQQKSLLAIDNDNDPSIESLRSLRTSLRFALLESKNNIVMITGPTPGIGKSFISSNFAAVLCSTESRVLLIDADMRKGYLHNLFSVGISPGLSSLIVKNHTVEEAIQTVKIGNKSLDIITRGKTPPNPSELLMHDSFKELLTKLSGMYDLILIDTPPVHAVTDPTIIGAFAGVTFMVVRHEQHTMKEIEHAVNRLSHTGIKTNGFIFNAHVAKKNRYGYNSYYGEYK